MNKKKSDKLIAIIGLGYVGLPLALEFSKKFNVIGFDIDPKRISKLNKSYDANQEISEKKISKSKNIIFTNNKKLLRNSKIYIVTVPTPVDLKNIPDLSKLIDATKLISVYLKNQDIVIYESTVYPGLTEEVCAPILSKNSSLEYAHGKGDWKTKNSFYLGYSPERINPGDKKNTLTKIKKIISGSTPEATNAINKLYSSIIKAGIIISPSIKIAEAAKILENTQRDINIAFINEASNIFSNLGLDSLKILELARTKWNFIDFKPGLVGGHCVSVDPYYLTYLARKKNIPHNLIKYGRRFNENMPILIANKIANYFNSLIKSNLITIGIFGLTFKENCSDFRNSKSLDMANYFKKKNFKTVLYDSKIEKYDFEKKTNYKLSNFKSIKNLNCIVLAVAHNDIVKISPKLLRSLCIHNGLKPLVYDLKGIYRVESLTNEGFEVCRP